jgi:UDP-N-acetylmuramoylalanine--D-glutamate ligase
MVVKDKNVLVFGSGISGEAACALLLKEEAKVILYDGNDKLNSEEIRAKIEGGDRKSSLEHLRETGKKNFLINFLLL